MFRTQILRAQGWHFVRVWTPQVFRDAERQVATVKREADALVAKEPAATPPAISVPSIASSELN